MGLLVKKCTIDRVCIIYILMLVASLFCLGTPQTPADSPSLINTWMRRPVPFRARARNSLSSSVTTRTRNMAGQCGAVPPAKKLSEVGWSWTLRSDHLEDLLFTNSLQSNDQCFNLSETQWCESSRMKQESGVWQTVSYPSQRACESSRCVREGSCNWDRIVCACRRNLISLAPNLAGTQSGLG